MTEQNPNGGRKLVGGLRGKLLVGTVAAVGLGGVLLGEVGLIENHAAFADPVRVEGVQRMSFADVVEKVQPAVVSVRVRSEAEVASMDMPNGLPFDFRLPDGTPFERFFREFRRGQGGDDQNQNRPQRRQTMSQGSGFFISEDGYLVTNNHVVEKSNEVVVVMDNGTEYSAKVIGTDDRTDLALLKVDGGDTKFTYVKLAEDPVRVGDWVVAVGNPFGLGGTVTAGIISGTGRQIGSGPYDDFIQIDAAVNRGNSGGPAFNLNGEVIGVNTAIYSPSGGNVGIAFAIPAHMVQQIVADLKDNGTVVRGWLGVQIQGVSEEIAAGLGLSEASGALVSEPQPDSPAAKVGIKAGDTILAVNGKPVKGPRELAVIIADYDPGTDVKLTVWRDGKKQDITVTLGTLEDRPQVAKADDKPAAAEPSALEGFGLTLAPSEDGKGVIVKSVDPTGPAAERGIEEGDVILSVGDASVSNPNGVEKSIADARSSGRKAVMMRIQSGDQVRYIAFPFDRG